MTIDSKLFSTSPVTKNLCAEISTLQIGFKPPKYITVKFPDNTEKDFAAAGIDFNLDEIAGWRYQEINGPLEMLIIND